ncbi:hypothetical protein QJQ45_002668 [Haematococcus lacustris]|nr:hypothetical protein QJQ45_002668 [Haematococcus lacustris]
MAGHLARSLGQLLPKQSALFVCDIQDRFRTNIKGFPTVISTARRLIKGSIALQLPIVVTEQYPKALGHTVVELVEVLPPAYTTTPLPSMQGQQGREAAPTAQSHHAVFSKTLFSMWTPEVQDHMSQALPHVKQVVLLGIETHVCVLQTALDLLARGYEVHVVVDGVSSQREVDRAVALQRLAQSGVFLASSEMVLFQLADLVQFMHTGDAKAPGFKAISELAKEERAPHMVALHSSLGNDINCTLGPGTTWQPAARLVTGTWLVAGHGTSSFLDLSLMTRASLAPGSRLVLQDLTLVTDIAVARASTPQHFLIPINLTGSGATSIAFSNVTLQLPSTCTTLASYASLLCRGAVNSNLLISRQGVVFRSWTTATVRSSNLKLTCGRPLPSAQHLACMSMVVAEPSELLAALAAAGGQAGGSTTYIHVLRNISLQGYAPDVHGGVVPGPLTNITNTLIISGLWRGIIDAQDLEARVIFQKLVLVNLPLGASLSLPIGLLTASIHFVEYVRGKL